MLRGSGIYGAVISTVKNTIYKFMEERDKGFKGDLGNVIVEAKQPEPTPEPPISRNQEAIELQKKRLAEKRQMLTKAGREGAYSNIFEGN